MEVQVQDLHSLDVYSQSILSIDPIQWQGLKVQAKSDYVDKTGISLLACELGIFSHFATTSDVHNTTTT